VSVDGQRAPLDWRWGQLGDVAYRTVDEAVKGRIAGELRDMAGQLDDRIDLPDWLRWAGITDVYGIRSAFLAFARHLSSDGIRAIETAVGRPAR
jgi:hypothetical protein